jgi:thioesterase domain-containing protein
VSGKRIPQTGADKSSGPLSTAAGHKSSGDPRDLLARIQREYPQLRAEDAFFVPTWFVQQKTWVQDPRHSDSYVYNYPLLLRVRGPLNASALRAGLQKIVQRHAVLRSVFRILDGELVQIIAPASDLLLSVTDLSNLPEATREAQAQRLALEGANRPFDLAQGPLLRARLISLATDDHILQLTTHHLVYDDWSTGILIRELSAFYQAFASGVTPAEPSLTYQYGDFVRWQEDRFQGPALESEVTYWKQQIKLPLATLVESPTIGQLAKILTAPLPYSSSSCLVAVQPNGTLPPLFCVHGHGGEIVYCWNLSRCLGTDQPLFGLRAQGLSEKTAHYTVEEMAAHYLNEIRTVQPRGPYYLGGYCFGGMVAYEMARLLSIQGEPVAMLAMFNTPAPGSLDGWPLQQTYLAKRITHELRKLGELRFRDKLELLGAKAGGLGKLALGSLKETMWKVSAKSPLRRAEKWTQHLLSVSDINVAAAKAYAPGPYAGRSILFLADEASSLYTIDPKDGWAPLITGGIEVHKAEGDNISMFDAQYIEDLVKELRPCLDRAQKSSQSPMQNV